MNENLLNLHLIGEYFSRYIRVNENFKFDLFHICDLLEHFACTIDERSKHCGSDFYAQIVIQVIVVISDVLNYAIH